MPKASFSPLNQWLACDGAPRRLFRDSLEYLFGDAFVLELLRDGEDRFGGETLDVWGSAEDGAATLAADTRSQFNEENFFSLRQSELIKGDSLSSVSSSWGGGGGGGVHTAGTRLKATAAIVFSIV